MAALETGDSGSGGDVRTGSVSSVILGIDRVYRRGLQAVCVALLFVMLGAVGLQVLMRYVFNDPLIWSEELARYAMIWLAFLSAALAMRERRHIALTGIVNPKGKWLATSIAVTTVVVVVVLVILGWQGWLMTIKTVHQVSPALGLSMSRIYVAIPISIVLMLAGLVLSWLVGPEPNAEPEESCR